MRDLEVVNQFDVEVVGVGGVDGEKKDRTGRSV